MHAQGTNPGSTWHFDPPADYYQFVAGGSGSACNTSADCKASGETCGTAQKPGNRVAQVCGQLVGYWTYGDLVSAT